MRTVGLDEYIYAKCNSAIIVSGSARSGTSILGNIIHSFEGVEYSFEAPMLFTMFSLISELPERYWKILYETYLYEEFLMNALAGRGLNYNRHDDSSVYHVKSEHLIEERLSRSFRKIDTEKVSIQSIIALKLPDITPFLYKLLHYYPETKIVIITRKALETFNSILKKGWFASETLNEKNINWPNRVINGMRIPFWVNPNDDERWYEMDELNRIAYYYIRENEALETLSDYIKIRYNDLIKNPLKTANYLANWLGLGFGEKTKVVLNTVNSRVKKNFDYSILERLDPKTKEIVEYYSNLS